MIPYLIIYILVVGPVSPNVIGDTNPYTFYNLEDVALEIYELDRYGFKHEKHLYKITFNSKDEFVKDNWLSYFQTHKEEKIEEIKLPEMVFKEASDD